MGCGIAHFGRRVPPKLTKFGPKFCSLGFGIAAPGVSVALRVETPPTKMSYTSGIIPHSIISQNMKSKQRKNLWTIPLIVRFPKPGVVEPDYYTVCLWGQNCFGDTRQWVLCFKIVMSGSMIMITMTRPTKWFKKDGNITFDFK